jgi:hypothetical protein
LPRFRDERAALAVLLRIARRHRIRGVGDIGRLLLRV